MTAHKVRADYESLAGMATRFGAQAGATRQMLQQLQRQVDVLRDGDWVGRGANAFYQEMTDSVLARVRRLAEALESAQHTTAQIRQIMQQAEDEAARVLRGEGNGVVTEAVNGAGPTGGDGLPGAPGASAAAGPAFVANIRGPNPRAIRQAMARRKVAAQNAAVDKMLSIFDPRVRELVKNSPTLRAQMLNLQERRFMFLTGTTEDGNKTTRPFITIVQPNSLAETVGLIAHEASHAVNNDEEMTRIAETPTMKRDHYVELNVAHYLRFEAAAQFNALQVRAELKAAGAGEIGVPGTSQDPAYTSVYADYAAGRITKDQAIDRMRPLVGNDLRSFPLPAQTYREYAKKFFENDWDKNIAPKRARQRSP